MRRVLRAVKSWIVSPAEWWQFWMPGSGLLGAMAATFVFIFLLALASGV